MREKRALDLLDLDLEPEELKIAFRVLESLRKAFENPVWMEHLRGLPPLS
jgi:hypothetical protein